MLTPIARARLALREYHQAVDLERRERPADALSRICEARDEACLCLSELLPAARGVTLGDGRAAVDLVLAIERDVSLGVVGPRELGELGLLLARIEAAMLAQAPEPSQAACELCGGHGEGYTRLGTGEGRWEPCPRCEERRAGEQDLRLALGDAPAESEAA